MDDNTKASYLIENTLHMTLATADSSGKPWSCPVFFAYDDAYNLYWVSYKEALHSKNIKTRPEVGISILGTLPDGSLDGLYLDTEVVELTDENDIKTAIETLHKRPQASKFTVNSPADVMDDAAWRIYKAILKTVYKRSDQGEVVNGQYVTTRVEVRLRGQGEHL